MGYNILRFQQEGVNHWDVLKGNTIQPFADEIHKIHDLEIKLWVNDELRQDAHTSQLITKPEQALTEVSQFVDLEVGDVVLTGTPGGVAIQAPNPKVVNLMRLLFSPKKLGAMMVKGQLKSGKFLKSGDSVRCSLKSSDGSVDCGEQKVTVIKSDRSVV